MGLCYWKRNHCRPIDCYFRGGINKHSVPVFFFFRALRVCFRSIKGLALGCGVQKSPIFYPSNREWSDLSRIPSLWSMHVLASMVLFVLFLYFSKPSDIVRGCCSIMSRPRPNIITDPLMELWDLFAKVVFLIISISSKDSIHLKYRIRP